MTDLERGIEELRAKLRSRAPYSDTWHRLNKECAALVRQWRLNNTLRSV